MPLGPSAVTPVLQTAARLLWPPAAARRLVTAAASSRRPGTHASDSSSRMQKSKQKSLDAFFKRPAATKAASSEEPASSSAAADAQQPAATATQPAAGAAQQPGAAAAAGAAAPAAAAAGDEQQAAAGDGVSAAQRLRAHANKQAALARQAVMRAEAAGGLPRLADLLVEDSWRAALAGEAGKQYWADLEAFVRAEWGGSQMVFPPKHDVFRWVLPGGCCPGQGSPARDWRLGRERRQARPRPLLAPPAGVPHLELRPTPPASQGAQQRAGGPSAGGDPGPGARPLGGGGGAGPAAAAVARCRRRGTPIPTRFHLRTNIKDFSFKFVRFVVP